MQDDRLRHFFLVGGTGLALQIGHRISLELDLFSTNPFDNDQMLSDLEIGYNFCLDSQNKNTLMGEIEGVKVDFITHNYPLVKPLLLGEGIQMASLYDIAAMKLNAISGNGNKLKNFIDVAYLSSMLTLSDMLDAYQEKYASRNPTMVIKALDYYQDINFDENIEMLGGHYSWENVKSRLSQMTLYPHKLFGQVPSIKKEQEKVQKKDIDRNRGLRL